MHMLPVDIHTHKHEPGVIALRSVRLGVDPLPAEGSFFSAGIHPWDSEKAGPQWLELLETLPLAAVGEIGLDYAVAVDRHVQSALLVRQLEIAGKRGVPVILHCVKAYNDLLPLLRSYDFPAIFHGFIGSEQLAGQVLGTGHYLSFGPTTFVSPKTVAALRSVPAGRLFLETDESGADINTVYEQAAAVRTTTVAALRNEIFKNHQKLFAK